MSWSLQLDAFSHDLRIKNGKIISVFGEDEVLQRIKISLWHYLGEYFLAPQNGIPWYTEILGKRISEATLTNLLKDEILKVPGVLRVVSLYVNRRMRDYIVECKVVVRSISGTKEVNLQGIRLAPEN